MTAAAKAADGVARRMWTLFEPIHAVTYFTPEGRSPFERAGLRGFWRGYFAGRAAPLGPAGPAVVAASFYTFAPPMVARALPSVWELITPADALRVRSQGAVAGLARVLDGAGADVAAAADLLWRAARGAAGGASGTSGGLDCAGRVLAAANAALPAPADPLARLWQAATLLREHRGDGHFAALVAAGIGGCGAEALRAGLDLDRGQVQPLRGWTDEQWQDAVSRLTARGLLGAGGRATAEGAATHRAIEEATDLAAGRPWADLGPGATADLAALLAPIARECAAEMPRPHPFGIPAPAAGRSGHA